MAKKKSVGGKPDAATKRKAAKEAGGSYPLVTPASVPGPALGAREQAAGVQVATRLLQAVRRTNGTANAEAEPKPDAEWRAFGVGLLLAQENERASLARELHGDLSQRLALLELNVATLESDEFCGEHCKQLLLSVHRQLTALSNSVRRMAYELHPAALEHLGLGPTVESYIQEFSAREGIQVRYQCENALGAIDPKNALCLYRTVQESLRNIAQHSGATAAEVFLLRNGDTVQLRVKDSGSGFELDSARRKRGLGLRSMEERARACGGSCQIATQPGAGTEVVVEIRENRPPSKIRT